MSAPLKNRLPSPTVIIGGRELTATQAEVLRVALMFARRDMEAGSGDLLAVSMLGHINDMIKIFDDVPVTL